ncbi:hypothetical protein [Actinomadura sp. 3N508]|uniref:hypothetical protein n=1 Tax=Actinomadura sp. 3N508 TaxID=3375153 RepID=UPI0037BA1570
MTATMQPAARPGGGRSGRSRVPGPALVLGSVVSIQAGMACGKGLFASVGPAGVVALRLGFAALILLLLWRPRPPRRESFGLVAALGRPSPECISSSRRWSGCRSGSRRRSSTSAR